MAQDPAGVEAYLAIAEQEGVPLQGVGPERAGGHQVVGAALDDHPGPGQAGGAVVGPPGGEDGPPGTAQLDQLRHLQLAELARGRQWRASLPGAQVGRGGVPEDAAPVGGPVVDPGADDHVEAAAGRVPEHPRVAPGLLAPRVLAGGLVPARVGLHDQRLALPGEQVVGGGQADPLHAATLPGRDARVEHVPAPTGLEHAAGPGGLVVEGARRARADRGRQDLPAPEVLGHGVADLGVAVPQVGMAQVTGGVQEEDVHVPAVGGEPEVPDPVPGQPQAQRWLPLAVPPTP